MKILIIEDEAALANGIKTYLEADQTICEIASTFDEAWLKSNLYEYDCILVDIGLPGGSGLELIRRLKSEHTRAGIIIISARDAVEDRISGLEMGSDDYLTKPFHLSELNARIKALMRRKQFGGQKSMQFKEITVFPDTRKVEVNSRELKLTPSEFELFIYFFVNRERVLSKESIAEHMIGDQADSLDNFDFIYSHIKNLRRKLIQQGAGDYIHAVYGIGYKFSNS